MLDSLIKRRADAHFSSLPGVDVDKTIMTESEAVAAAVAAKSARLKELRLARDAAEQAAPVIPMKKTGKKNSKNNGKKKHPAVSLSDWLKNRQAAGHSH
jgi:ribosomal protein L12E/L44/L45/RPP1/RPP2